MRGRIIISLLLGAALGSVQAATITVMNMDGPGEGFNDPTAVAMVGGNTGTTLGQQRLNVFQAAADRWAQFLDSNVTIVVNANFDPLFCSMNSATLGSAGTTYTAGIGGVANHAALADALTGVNQLVGPDINATFNSDVDDDPTCLGGDGWYYGLDQKPAGNPASALFPVVLHELGHGLGFSAIVNDATGAFTGAGGLPDAFSANLFDLSNSLFWDQMSNAQRLASALNDPNLVWGGANVDAQASNFLDPAPEVVINAPAGIAGTFPGVLGDEPNATIPGGGITAGLVDGNTFNDGCSQFFSGGAMNNRIVLIDSTMNCNAAVPAFYAEFEGALGVIVRNTAAMGLPDVTGQISNQDVMIPSVGVTQAVGDDLRANIGTANVTLQNSASVLRGENMGMTRMHVPAVFEPGSSVSHWTPAAGPDLLMEPSLGELDFDQVDLTVPAFEDMGWPLLMGGGVIFESSFEDGE